MLGAIVCVLIANALIFGGRVFSWVADGTVGIVSGASARLGWFNTVRTTIVRRIDLAVRTTELEAQNEQLRGALVRLDEVQREATTCRETANITVRPSGSAVQAGIFAYSISAGVRQAILNRGTDDGITVGDVVMTSSGALVGVVRSVFSEHAIVLREQDVAFEATARIAGSDVAGLVRSDGDRSLVLDLIQKDEHIDEEALVVTSGDDRYPAGLIIGTVRSVNNTAATLFQIVRIEPKVPDAIHGHVLVIRP